jgi:glycosidase
VWAAFPSDRLAASWAMAGSHDSPRLLTTLANPQARYKNGESLRENPAYQGSSPDSDAGRALRLYRVMQFTLPGAPIIYYGDEAGMWGADDPDNRRPMVWRDLVYDGEFNDEDCRSRPALVRPPDAPLITCQVYTVPVGPDVELIAFHASLARLRRAHADVLSHAPVEWLAADDARGVLVYRRGSGADAVTVAVNTSYVAQQTPGVGGRTALAVGEATMTAAGLQLGPRSAAIVVP